MCWTLTSPLHPLWLVYVSCQSKVTEKEDEFIDGLIEQVATEIQKRLFLLEQANDLGN